MLLGFKQTIQTKTAIRLSFEASSLCPWIQRVHLSSASFLPFRMSDARALNTGAPGVVRAAHSGPHGHLPDHAHNVWNFCNLLETEIQTKSVVWL